LHSFELLIGSGQSGFQARDFAQPALAVGLGDAGGEVVTDLVQAGHLDRIRSQEWAPYAAVLVRTRTAEVAGAYAEGHLA
jgi:hypothetical protein